MKFLLKAAVAATFMLAAAPSYAASILIVNGSSGTSEPGTTSLITDNLKMLHEAVGNVVSVVSDVPATFAGFFQIWDIRFSNNLAITGSEQAQYLGFLQGGGGMFVMGENNSFTTRNNSVLSLIDAAGGGSLGFAIPSSGQTVNAPFDQPNLVTSIGYLAPGGVNGAGSGQFITDDGTNGTGVAWAKGTLTNAPLGALTAIFDVNFMQGDVGDDSQNLLKNLIGFVDGEVNPPSAVPVPAALPLLVLALGALGMVRRRTAA